MRTFKNTEELLSWIVDFFADRFGNSAVIKGGVSLRLMHSPRFTNDVDYVFVPFASKKDAKGQIEDALRGVEGLEFQTSLNSKALRIRIDYSGQSAQVEISAERECPSIPMSTSLLSSPYGFPTRIVRIMEPSTSFAHKLAAWNERELMRDLFDIYQYHSFFRLSPNRDVLERRLKIARSYKGVSAAKSMAEFVGKLRNRADSLSGADIEELRPLLDEENLSGLLFRLRPAMLSLAGELERGAEGR